MMLDRKGGYMIRARVDLDCMDIDDIQLQRFVAFEPQIMYEALNTQVNGVTEYRFHGTYDALKSMIQLYWDGDDTLIAEIRTEA
jgi:hypothetical protein